MTSSTGGQLRLEEGQQTLGRRVGAESGLGKASGGSRRAGELWSVVGRLSEALGGTVEEDPASAIAFVLTSKSFGILEEPAAVQVDGEVELVLPPRRP
ncbi:MAG: hypothetical protein ACYDH5_04405 [Acidimicrobiales bacterium]